MFQYTVFLTVTDVAISFKHLINDLRVWTSSPEGPSHSHIYCCVKYISKFAPYEMWCCDADFSGDVTLFLSRFLRWLLEKRVGLDNGLPPHKTRKDMPVGQKRHNKSQAAALGKAAKRTKRPKTQSESEDESVSRLLESVLPTQYANTYDPKAHSGLAAGSTMALIIVA